MEEIMEIDLKNGKKEAIIVDLDGTLADIEERLHHIEKDPKDWESFSKEIHTDLVNKWCERLMTAMKKQGCKILLVTGRMGNQLTRCETENWLERWEVPWSIIYYRGDQDIRPDDVVKKEIYQKSIEPFFDVQFVVEDRARVVKMWREIGLICLQCAEGDF